MKLLPVSIFSILLCIACGNSELNKSESTTVNVLENQKTEPFRLTLAEANQLVELPLAGIQRKYPTKLAHVLGSKDDLKEPFELYPAFYGCFDWHSAVHGHWSLVKLLKEFPDIDKADTIKTLLLEHISKQNIETEADYFKQDNNKLFERTYGWAWLLKLAEEIHTWDSPLARELEENLQPLTTQIETLFMEYMPKLRYPIRVGEHSNTAFALSFAYDYAVAVQNNQFADIIIAKAKEFYLNDVDYPFAWEPGGYDFLSPCFEEIDLMRRVLPKEEFDGWLKSFLPLLMRHELEIKVAEVSDRTDGKMVHLDGLNYSRAWVLYGLAKQDSAYQYLIDVANKHVAYSLPNLVSDSYEGGHWLGTFAIYALTQ